MIRLQNSRPSNASWHVFFGANRPVVTRRRLSYTQPKYKLRSAVLWRYTMMTCLQNARPRKACRQELFRSASPPRRHPQAVVLHTGQIKIYIPQCCRDTHHRHACRMLRTGRLAGKSYFGKTGRKRVSIASAAPSASAAPPQGAELVVPTEALT